MTLVQFKEALESIGFTGDDLNKPIFSWGGGPISPDELLENFLIQAYEYKKKI